MAAKLMTSRFPSGAIPNNINIIFLSYPSQSIKLSSLQQNMTNTENCKMIDNRVILTSSGLK